MVIHMQTSKISSRISSPSFSILGNKKYFPFLGNLPHEINSVKNKNHTRVLSKSIIDAMHDMFVHDILCLLTFMILIFVHDILYFLTFLGSFYASTRPFFRTEYGEV